ncbi:MAG: hypothetical protein JW774_02550 [Candidatus Aureabacteria bacterium]|nr:hypothetical protein [Candidatus Auribacterota bacterium]
MTDENQFRFIQACSVSSILSEQHLLHVGQQEGKTSMPYSVSFDEKMGIIGVAVSSPCEKQDHYDAMNRTLELCREHACSRILVDLRHLNTKQFTVTGCYHFGRTLAEQGVPCKIAHVLPDDGKSKEKVTFTSLVQMNRGVASCVFETMEDAREWLQL